MIWNVRDGVNASGGFLGLGQGIEKEREKEKGKREEEWQLGFQLYPAHGRDFIRIGGMSRWEEKGRFRGKGKP